MPNEFRTQIETQYLGQFTLTSGTSASPTWDFPKGELWYRLNLYIQITLTVGGASGNTALADDVLELVNQVRLEVNRDNVLTDAPSKALYRRAQLLDGSAHLLSNASLNVNANAAYAMSFHIPIIFADPRMQRPEDTALASDRYNYVKLSVGVGAGTDLLAVNSAGTFVLSAMTCDVEVVKLKGPIPDGARPIGIPKFLSEGTNMNVASVTQQALARNFDRAIKRLFVHAGNIATAGRIWSGNGNNSIVSKATVQSDLGNHQDTRLEPQIRNDCKTLYQAEATYPAGIYVFDFVRDGSNLSALKTGDKAYLNFTQVNNGSLPAGTNCVSFASDLIVSPQA